MWNDIAGIDWLTWPGLAHFGLGAGLGWFDPADRTWGREILQRGIAAIFFIAFLSTRNQFPALLGEHGLMPVPRLLERTRLRRPTLFQWRGVRYSDRLLRGMCWVGMALALAVVAGLPQQVASWTLALAFLAMWFLAMSIANVGQTFYGFGWEMLLLEAGFLTAFTGAAGELPPQPLLVLVAWLLFRLEFGAGMIKWRGGREWRDLTAMQYHHETQPMPGPLSRQAHLLPTWFHRCEVAANFVAQLAFPWLLFLPEPLASIGAAMIVGTQLWLVVTGNFAWLNWATIVLALGCVSDPVYHAVLGLPEHVPGRDALVAAPAWWALVVWGVVVLLVVLSRRPAANLASRHQLMNASFDRWQLVNAYGAFGTVTKRRIEVDIEGLEPASGRDDETAGASSRGPARRWLPYGFRGKPGDVRRLPRQWAPYHLRLDWLMWFLPFGPVQAQPWFLTLLVKLLEADPATLRLLRDDPFGGHRPAAIRVRTYRYRFATRAEHRATGTRWMRELEDEPIGPISLDDLV